MQLIAHLITIVAERDSHLMA